jgi:hypothetical protein
LRTFAALLGICRESLGILESAAHTTLHQDFAATRPGNTNSVAIVPSSSRRLHGLLLTSDIIASARMPTKTIAVVNSTGRQAASLIRVASAVGYKVHAQLHSSKDLATQEATNLEEISELENVTLFEGRLEDKTLLRSLFSGAQLAFINTTSWGDEVAIGRAIADAAKQAGTIQHLIYSSMPDHSIYGRGWPALPNWSSKFTVENYIRQLGVPATFVYCGIYNNNFTSLPYPLFQMELKPPERGGGFQWQAPFDPDLPLPWLDAEHDVGPAVIQIFKDGVGKWGGHR